MESLASTAVSIVAAPRTRPPCWVERVARDDRMTWSSRAACSRHTCACPNARPRRTRISLARMRGATSWTRSNSNGASRRSKRRWKRFTLRRLPARRLHVPPFGPTATIHRQNSGAVSFGGSGNSIPPGGLSRLAGNRSAPCVRTDFCGRLWGAAGRNGYQANRCARSAMGRGFSSTLVAPIAHCLGRQFWNLAGRAGVLGQERK
jgi:hypothetical protein